jgi:hypothetical protein
METTEQTGYKKPMKFGAQTLYNSEFLSKINQEHWEEFDKKVKSGDKDKGYGIGDFIQNAVDITAIQMVQFLREIAAMDSIEQVREKANSFIAEISKEVDLATKEKNTKAMEESLKAKEEARPVIEKETMESVMLEALCTAPDSQMETHIKETCIAFRDKGGYTAGELYD